MPDSIDAVSGAMDAGVLFVTSTRAEYVAVRAAAGSGVVLCGMGPARARALCRALDSAGWMGRMVLLGWAGGISPDLAAGDVVVADAALCAHHPRLALAPPDVSGARVGALLTVPAPLLTPQAKSEAARPGVLAVEMEAYPLAAWAGAKGVPFVHARVILDTRTEALPDLGDALDAFGGVRWTRLMQRVVTGPRVAISLLSLARRVRKLTPTLRALARAAAALGQESE